MKLINVKTLHGGISHVVHVKLTAETIGSCTASTSRIKVACSIHADTVTVTVSTLTSRPRYYVFASASWACYSTERYTHLISPSYLLALCQTRQIRMQRLYLCLLKPRCRFSLTLFPVPHICGECSLIRLLECLLCV